jgi:hypothetical protein
MIILGALARSGGIGFRRFGCAATVEMPAAQNQIPAVKPFSRLLMQFLPVGLQKRFVGAVADERIGKYEIRTILANEITPDQSGAIVIRRADHMTQGFEAETVADHRCRQQCLFVHGCKSVQTRQHDTLDRIRDVARLRCVGIN